LLDVTPTLVNYDARKTGLIDVHVANITTQTVVIPPRTLLCELQPVSREVEEETDVKGQCKATYMDQIHVNESKLLTPEQTEILRETLRKRPENFSQHDKDVGHTSRVKHDINLTNDIPFKERHRHIPPRHVRSSA
jgi:hypothetical protein